jgi:2-methylcitrate dehydratase PrpD
MEDDGHMVTESATLKQDLGVTLAQHVDSTTFESLPPEAVKAAKYSLLDTLGVMLGASGLSAPVAALVDLARDWGGKPESTVVGFGGKVPAVTASFVNGAMGHALDFDDHLPEGAHPSVSLVPAMLAIAEREGGVTGKDFITALAVGQDIFARIRRNVAWKEDWFITPVIGAYAAAASCSKLLGLSKFQTLDAFGAASCQSAGTMQLAFGTGGDLRGMYAAFSAKAGALSAVLAQSGVRGTTTPFEGRAGFLPTYFGEWDRDAMLAELGEEYQGSSVLYKLWPCCGMTHAYIHSVLELVGGPDRASKVHRVELIGGESTKRLAEPLASRRRPNTELDAKFSLPYTVALALVTGTVRVGDFSEKRRSDPEIGAMADKIEFVEDPDPSFSWDRELPSAAVRITLDDGQTLYRKTSHDNTPGAALMPLEWEQLVAKFTDCAAHAAKPLPTDAIEQLVHGIDVLEALADVSIFASQFG